MLLTGNKRDAVGPRSATHDDEVNLASVIRWLIDAWRQQWPTLVLLVFLALVATLCYLASTWTAIHLSQSARMLAETEKRVAAHHGNEAELQRELILQLSSIQRRDDLSDVMLHLAIACFVAILVILMVEIYSAYRTRNEIATYREEVAQEVWSALSGQLVPPSVVDQIRGILKSEVVKEGVNYTLTFLRYDGLPQNVIVLQRKVSYVLRNLTGRRVAHTVNSFIQNVSPDIPCQETSGAKVTLPRHRELYVRGNAVELSEKAGTLRRNAQNQLRDLSYQVTLGRKDDRAEVFIISEEPVPIGGSNTYTQTVPVTGITISIDNRIDDVIAVRDVDFAHPNWEDFAAGADRVYRYPGAVLPGQSFTVFWEATRRQAPKSAP